MRILAYLRLVPCAPNVTSLPPTPEAGASTGAARAESRRSPPPGERVGSGASRTVYDRTAIEVIQLREA